MSKSPRLAELITRYVAEQATVIIDAEGALRAREPVVHPTRVAIRRLRSTGRVFGKALDPARTQALEGELVWLAGLLGAIRDLDILADRLRADLDALPPELVLGPVRTKLTEAVETRRTAGWTAVTEVLDTDRFRLLLAELHRWRSDTPVNAEDDQPGSEVKAFVKKAGTKVDRRLRQAVRSIEAGEPGAGDLLHGARKAGKRHRYAVELALPVLGVKGEQLIEDRKNLQDVLGDHQDSLVAAEFLRSEGARLGVRSGNNGFTYGLLYAQETERQRGIVDRLKPFR